VIEELNGYDLRGILADIGISSLQIDKSERGFGFDSQTLDMRMDQNSNLSAKDVVNSYDKEELERIFRDFGEIKEYKKMALLIVENRPFKSSKELSDLIAKKFRSKKLHPATLTFQAIRIEVNDELEELKKLLDTIKNLNISNLLVAIISFHSLEDRIVKRAFKEWSKSCICPPQAMKCECGGDRELGAVLTKKPITPKGEEIARNPRSRSSKLRIFRFKKR
jgi:16S rRNA (cytosine1402-N4)-methyltransferase